MELFAFLSADDLTPIFVFVAIVAGTFWVLSMISNRNSQAEERLERIGRPKSLVEIELDRSDDAGRFKGLKEAFSNLGGVMSRPARGRRTRCGSNSPTRGSGARTRPAYTTGSA